MELSVKNGEGFGAGIAKIPRVQSLSDGFIDKHHGGRLIGRVRF